MHPPACRSSQRAKERHPFNEHEGKPALCNLRRFPEQRIAARNPTSTCSSRHTHSALAKALRAKSMARTPSSQEHQGLPPADSFVWQARVERTIAANPKAAKRLWSKRRKRKEGSFSFLLSERIQQLGSKSARISGRIFLGHVERHPAFQTGDAETGGAVCRYASEGFSTPSHF